MFDSPRYEFVSCLGCGKTHQLIDFGGAFHTFGCKKVEPNPAEVDAAFLRHGYVLDVVRPMGDRTYRPAARVNAR
jgi:hypothetical protein